MIEQHMAWGGRAKHDTASIDVGCEADFSIAFLAVRPSERQIVHHGEILRIEPRVMQVLVALARTPGAIVSRDLLLASCWGGHLVSNDAIDRCAAQVRRLGEQTGAFQLGTVPRVGYRLTPTPKAPDVSSAGQEAHRVRRRVWPWIVGAAGGAAMCSAAVAGGALLSPADPIPRSISWTYHLGKFSDAPNGFRFWNSSDGRTWNEAYADGRVRAVFVMIVSRFRGPNGCDGALLRRDRSMIVFVPDAACPARQLLAQDINPNTGMVERPWFVLGAIIATAPHPLDVHLGA